MKLTKEDFELAAKVEGGLPTLPKERWKTAVWWIIVALGLALWIVVKVRS